jgi:hypothetical protein
MSARLSPTSIVAPFVLAELLLVAVAAAGDD